MTQELKERMMQFSTIKLKQLVAAIALSLITMYFMAHSSSAQATTEIGKQAPNVELKGDNGGRTDGTPWNSTSILGKVYSLFYVDPDEKDANTALEVAIANEKFDRKKYGSIAVINLAATWKPNFIIEKILAGKQEDYPDTIYVKDKVSTLVKTWKLEDNAYNVLLFDKAGNLIFKRAGTLAKSDISEYLALIKKNL